MFYCQLCLNFKGKPHQLTCEFLSQSVSSVNLDNLNKTSHQHTRQHKRMLTAWAQVQQSAQILLQDKSQEWKCPMSANVSSLQQLDLSRFCYHIFVISQTPWLNCQQSYRLKYVKSHKPQVFYSHCCPKHCENGIPSSERLPGHQVIACLVPFVYMKKRWILNSLSYRHKLTSFEHLQVNQEALNELNSHEDGGRLCSDHP